MAQREPLALVAQADWAAQPGLQAMAEMVWREMTVFGMAVRAELAAVAARVVMAEREASAQPMGQRDWRLMVAPAEWVAMAEMVLTPRRSMTALRVAMQARVEPVEMAELVVLEPRRPMAAMPDLAGMRDCLDPVRPA